MYLAMLLDLGLRENGYPQSFVQVVFVMLQQKNYSLTKEKSVESDVVQNLEAAHSPV